MRRGFTLIEMSIVLVIVGIMVCIAAPRIARYTDRLAVRRAGDDTAAFYNRARIAAVYNATRLKVSFSDDSLVATTEGVADTVVWRTRGPARFGVALSASRSEIRLYPNGLGLGAANTKLVFRRGDASDSLTISRLGRLKR